MSTTSGRLCAASRSLRLGVGRPLPPGFTTSPSGLAGSAVRFDLSLMGHKGTADAGSRSSESVLGRVDGGKSEHAVERHAGLLLGQVVHHDAVGNLARDERLERPYE